MGFIERVSNRVKSEFIKALIDFVSIESLLRYNETDLTGENFTNDYDIPPVWRVNQLIAEATTGGTTATQFTQADLVSMGDGFFKLPLVLTGTQSILAVKIEIDGGDKYQKPASDWINDEIINFDSNATQTITVITS